MELAALYAAAGLIVGVLGSLLAHRKRRGKIMRLCQTELDDRDQAHYERLRKHGERRQEVGRLLGRKEILRKIDDDGRFQP